MYFVHLLALKEILINCIWIGWRKDDRIKFDNDPYFLYCAILAWRNSRRARLKSECPNGRAGASPAVSIVQFDYFS